MIILNGVDPDVWRAGPGGVDAVWSGRLVPEKAPHLAIDAARRAGRAITVAGPVLDKPYFDREIRPRLGDEVRYVGHLDQRRLCDLVGASRGGGRHPAVGRALRAGGRRGHGLWHASGRLRSRCSHRDRRRQSRGGWRAPRTWRHWPGRSMLLPPATEARFARHAVEAHGLTRMVDDYEALFRRAVARAAA